MFEIDPSKLEPAFFCNGRAFRIYNNFNLSIFAEDRCNADCGFCVAQLRYETRSKAYKKEKMKSKQAYLDRLQRVLRGLDWLHPSVSITGGEPTLCPVLFDIISMVARMGIRKRVITTNGSNLLDRHPLMGKNLLLHLIDKGFQHINISRAHFADPTNQAIMKFDGMPCTNDMLSQIIPVAQQFGMRPRMSCVLLAEGISTFEQVIDYIRFYKRFGCDNVIFREVMDFQPTNMVNEAKIEYCGKNRVPLEPIIEQMKCDPRFWHVTDIVGYYYHVTVFKFEGVDVCLESANLSDLIQQQDDNPDIIYELVFHPNGNVTRDWIDSSENLMPENTQEDRS